ncbi:hypothetical protein KSP40_PGU007989 [Platanthera guangdongensis]|uniref:Uncharacterized protein n=1 Tax=Platanthera guangdongensis TaxID=2320717 RepID=A0ABR2MCG2_9ASPA
MRRIEEKKVSWRRKEHMKIKSIVEAMKFELNRERKGTQRLKKLNFKLLNELTVAKLSPKRIWQEYERERKAHAILNDICNEMANEIGDNEAEVVAMKSESAKNNKELEGIEERPMKRYGNMMFDGNCGAEDERCWEIVALEEEQGSSKSPGGSEPSVNGWFVNSQALVWSTEVSEICSAATRLSRKKGSSMSRLWKSLGANKADDFKKKSSGSPYLQKPHAMNEQDLMVKLMEEGIQSQKVQIRQILREKI